MKNIGQYVVLFALTIVSLCLTGYLLGLKECPIWLIFGWAFFWCFVRAVIMAIGQVNTEERERKEKARKELLEQEMERNCSNYARNHRRIRRGGSAARPGR